MSMFGLWILGIYIIYFRWTQGKYGVGHRIPFQDSVKIIDAINDGLLDKVETYKFKYFNFPLNEISKFIGQSL